MPGSLPVARIGPSPVRREVLARRVRLLVAATITYNVVEAVVAITAGSLASSMALIGFGLDSVVEVASAAAVAWQFHDRDHERRERTAMRIIAVSFFALAAYVGVESLRALLGGDRAEHSTVGVVLAVVSLMVMPVLAAAQRRAGRELGSASAVADSRQTLLCTYLSAVLLVGLAVNALFGWWWADPLAALAIAAVAVREGWQAWRGDACCTPPAALGPVTPAAADERAGACAPRSWSHADGRAQAGVRSPTGGNCSTPSPDYPGSAPVSRWCPGTLSRRAQAATDGNVDCHSTYQEGAAVPMAKVRAGVRGRRGLSANLVVTLVVLAVAAVVIAGVLLFGGEDTPADSGAGAALGTDGNVVTQASEGGVTIVEFLDYQCPACAAYYHNITRQLERDYQGRVTLITRNFPLETHPLAVPAARAAEAAAEQGRYPQMYHALYDNYQSWALAPDGQSLSDDQRAAEAQFGEYARQIGLDLDQFRQDMNSPQVQRRIDRDRAAGQQAGVNSTPTFFVNGTRFQPAGDSFPEVNRQLRGILDNELAR